jgi:hypothetical protein
MALEFVEIADDIAREDVLAPPAHGEKAGAATAFLLVALSRGRRPSADVKAEGAATAERFSRRTIERAAQELEVVVETDTTPTGRVTFWSLPEGVAPTPSTRIWRDPSGPHEQRDSGPSEGGSRQALVEIGDGATPPVPECVVCERPFEPEQEGASALRCPDCVRRAQERKGSR